MDATVSLFDAKRREFHLDRYRFAANRVKGKDVLDCACGTGYGVRLLHEEGEAANVIGVDIDEKTIEYAGKKHQVGNTHFVCAIANQLPIADDSVDVITSFETIEHVPDDAALIKEFYRVLRASGVLIISTPNQWPLATAPFHVREYSRTSLIELLESKFDCLELYNQNSGSDTTHNHGQTRGIVTTSPSNQDLAECYIAICQRKSFPDGERDLSRYLPC
jgi:ubiquinone/menaquinone biosynthesis C-methylase UbiE